MSQPGEPGEGERTSLGSRTLPHRAIPEERPRDLPRSAATSRGRGGRCPPAAWDTTALDVRHEPASFPCWRSACHSPGSHPPASVWLFRTSNRAHGGGRTPPLWEEAQGGAEAPPRSQELAGWRSHGTDRSDSERQSPREGVRGREERMARAERSGAGAFLLCPLGGDEARQGAASVRARCRADGGQEAVAWQPSRSRGQSGGDAVSAAALTGPRAAAQTGLPLRPLVREPVVAWTPRRPRLGGVPHGAAVDDGGVGPWPARPSDSAVSAPCRRRA